MTLTQTNDVRTLNGFDLGKLEMLAETASRGVDSARAAFHVRSDWKGGTRTEAVVSGYELGGEHIARQHRIRTDEPRELTGTDEAPNPQELLFAALNACIMFGYAAGAAEMGFELQSLSVETRGQLDLRGSLEMADVPVGFPKIDYTVRIKADATAAQLEELHQKVMRTSPNYYHISQPIPLEARLVIE